jgi:methylmalonyl-CoA/ethylmalonyl-CoA epimerase
MKVLKNIHHLNFVVADLDAAVTAYQNRLGLGPFHRDDLPHRGVSTARVKVGDTWIVLVSPRRDDCDVARYLATHGEGFLLMSFGVDDLDHAIGKLAERGTVAGDARAGLCDWWVVDLKTEAELGVRFHLTQTDVEDGMTE